MMPDQNRDAASLHGKLVHISCIFPLIQPFLCGIAPFVHCYKSPQLKLRVFLPLHADLSWVCFLIKSLPNKTPLASPEPVDLQWWGDASTSFGIGVVLGSHLAVWRWAPSLKVGPHQEFDIGWAEAVAVKLGLRLALELGLFANPVHRGYTFLVLLDNTGIVAVTNKGRSCSRKTNKILKHAVYLLQAQHHIQLKTIHVASHNNILDALSWGSTNEFLTGFPSVNTHASILPPAHLLDKLITSP
jgi:hypothetical protein